MSKQNFYCHFQKLHSKFSKSKSSPGKKCRNKLFYVIFLKITVNLHNQIPYTRDTTRENTKNTYITVILPIFIIENKKNI